MILTSQDTWEWGLPTPTPGASYQTYLPWTTEGDGVPRSLQTVF